MGKQAKTAKDRTCASCGKTLHMTAAELKAHVAGGCK